MKFYSSRAPQVQIVQNHNVLIQGTDFEIFCELTEGSSAQIIWSKRDGELANNVYVHGQVLKISQVSPENDGFYICIAENNVGKDQIEMFIEVESKCKFHQLSFPLEKVTELLISFRT